MDDKGETSLTEEKKNKKNIEKMEKIEEEMEEEVKEEMEEGVGEEMEGGVGEEMEEEVGEEIEEEEEEMGEEIEEGGKTKKMKIFLPGELICSKEKDLIGGDGTYEEENNIYASITGQKKVIRHTNNTTRIMCIYGGHLLPAQPKINSDVLARVNRILPRRAECDILCVDDRLIFGSYKGHLRIQDVRKYEASKLDMLECFKPLDIIKAKIIGREGRQFILSTAEDKYGVISGVSTCGATLEAISWRFMRCNETGKLELRKTARIFPSTT